MTIKCPSCNNHSLAQFYNHKSLIYMKKNNNSGSFKPIQTKLNSDEHSYVCPKCNEISKGSQFEEVN